MSRALAVLLAALALAAPLAQGNASRMDAAAYVGGPGDFIAVCPAGAPVSVGGACFQVAGDERSATVFVNDLTGYAVGAFYRFRDAQGATLAQGSFCGDVAVAVPAGAASLTVLLDEVSALWDCPSWTRPGAATAGEILVYWR